MWELVEGILRIFCSPTISISSWYVNRECWQCSCRKWCLLLCLDVLRCVWVCAFCAGWGHHWNQENIKAPSDSQPMDRPQLQLKWKFQSYREKWRIQGEILTWTWVCIMYIHVSCIMYVSFHRNHIPKWYISSSFPETNSKSTWKWMVGRWVSRWIDFCFRLRAEAPHLNDWEFGWGSATGMGSEWMVRWLGWKRSNTIRKFRGWKLRMGQLTSINHVSWLEWSCKYRVFLYKQCRLISWIFFPTFKRSRHLF